MAKQETVIRLLQIEDTLEDAESIVNALRNGGIAVRSARPESIEELIDQLGKQQPDLVVAAWSGKRLPFAEVAQAMRKAGRHAALVASHSGIDEATLLEACALGAFHIVLRQRPEQILPTLKHAWLATEARRSQQRLEDALRETARRCDALIDSSRDPIAYAHEGMHIRANHAYLEMFGYTDFEEVEGMPLLDLIAPSHAGEFKALLKRLSKGEPPPEKLELKAMRADGIDFDAVMEFARASYEGEPCLQIVFRKQFVDSEELQTLRERDQVTGLLNRQVFLAELEAAAARAENGAKDQAALLIEVDNFGNLLNDIGLGHADTLLADAATLLRHTLGDDVLLARFADHTFGLVCRGSNHAQTRELAERVRMAFEGHILEIGSRSATLTVSIGGVQMSEKSGPAQQVLGKAGQCLQAAISEGGNRLSLFDPAARDRAEEERVRTWVARIQQALKSGDFMLHYQPIISLQGEPVEFYETLLRMRVGDGEIAPPLAFLPIAEEHGLIEKVDRWVLSHAIAVLAKVKSEHERRLLVKITPQSMQDPTLPGWIANLLKQTGVRGEQLVFGVPETRVMTYLKGAKEFQRAVAKLGCGMCLEQYGASTHSLDVLKHLEPTMLKLDRSFTEDLGRNTEHQAKVRELAARAGDLGKSTIAEFVQDAASMTVLFTSSVHFVQGNFLAAPAPEMNYDFNI
ncbi:EAL domain-containing response regulator [Aquimonas voraii]|uniref:PAS domain S-box-containing protein/diguanylate cyclase (GGDEF) domain-containing protein n=1 Tax=Aquimonas voraii TaxID=265719 RepID=A0A1G6RSU0_9GAMM|nr:EAL domain-containing protein [Aquimonas voraii]SDD07025.1 PAS domain S-box-containing protein/diguanylate cyclase (GGDEF) domain-containing protein [Aquimonas voraii]